MEPIAPAPRVANAQRAAAAIVFARERYLAMAIEHNLAVNVRAADMRARFDRGEYPKPGWEQEAKASASAQAEQLISALRASFITSLVVLLLGLLVAAVLGKVSPSLPLSESKLLSTVGGFLAAWATLFELGGYVETYSGEAMHEVVRPVLFKSIFLSGIAIAALGQLW